jgi:imidazolonepropionase-like amidohydrolase
MRHANPQQPLSYFELLCSTSAMVSSILSALRRKRVLRSRARAQTRARASANFGKFRPIWDSLALLAALLIASPAAADTYLLRPDRVFDGVNPAPHEGWSVLVDGDKIAAAGPNLTAPAGTKVVDLPGTTLMPGMIEGHSHLFLHPYNETLWDDQVLHEPLALRTARAVVHARVTLEAGFTTDRDLGTEGAGIADVGLKQAINQGIIPGPRMLVATKAIVARGAYGPKGFEPGVVIPQGAQEVSGVDEMTYAARDLIAGGGVVVKMYSDYH